MNALTIKEKNLMDVEMAIAQRKLILMIGPDSTSSPIPTREFRDLFHRYGNPVRYRQDMVELESGFLLIYKSYTSIIRGIHPDMIVIVNVYLMDPRKWWQVLAEQVFPMVRDETIVKYWRW